MEGLTEVSGGLNEILETMEDVKLIMTTLGNYIAARTKSLDPRKFPDEEFELFSVPSHAVGQPEVVNGKDIGASKQMVDDDTVLLCKINPRINRTWVVRSHTEHRKIASSEWMAFPPHPDFVPEYLSYYLSQDKVRDHLSINASGVGGSLMRAKPALLKDYPFPLYPLPQQRRIVAAIETQLGRLDAAVASLHAAKAKLKRYKQAVLKAAFTEGDHPMTLIGDIYEVFVGSTPSRNKPELWNGVIHWVSSGEVAFCEIFDTRERITEEGLGNRATRLHPPGTVMLAMIGEGKTRGQAAILRVPAAHNQNTAAIRMPTPEYSSEYLYFYFVYEYDNTRRVGGGNNQMALNKSRIQSIRIPMPDPFEQHRIASVIKERFTIVEEAETTLDVQLAQASRLRQAVLKRAFEGKLA